MTVKLLVAPGTASPHWAVLRAPREDLVPTKTLAYDNGVLLDDPVFKPIDPFLVELAHQREPNELLWVNSEKFPKLFSAAVERLGLTSLHLVRYSVRHSGPSHSLLHRFRGEEEVRARGGWASYTSVRRYGRVARAQYFSQKFPVPVLEYGQRVLENLGPILSGSMVLEPPPTAVRN